MSRQEVQAWRDPTRLAAERVGDLLSQMTLEEKAARLTSVWLGDEPRDSDMATMQGEFTGRPQLPASWGGHAQRRGADLADRQHLPHT
jgi:hypothetical protein